MSIHEMIFWDLLDNKLKLQQNRSIGNDSLEPAVDLSCICCPCKSGTQVIPAPDRSKRNHSIRYEAIRVAKGGYAYHHHLVWLQKSSFISILLNQTLNSWKHFKVKHDEKSFLYQLHRLSSQFVNLAFNFVNLAHNFGNLAVNFVFLAFNFVNLAFNFVVGFSKSDCLSRELNPQPFG